MRGQPLVHYFGGAGSGVWKTADGGAESRAYGDTQKKILAEG